MESQILNIMTQLIAALDGHMGHWDPNMWNHMLPFGFYFEMPTMWFWLILSVIIIGGMASIITLVILNDRQNNQA